MNPIAKNALAFFVALVGFSSGPSFAQDGTCACVTAYRNAAGPIGHLGSVNGDVMISQAAGYGPAKAGNALDFGSRVVVGQKGSASILVGTCKLSVPSNSSLDISRVGNNICLKAVGSEQTAAINRSGHVGGFGPPEAIFAGALITTGVVAAVQNNNNAVSH